MAKEFRQSSAPFFRQPDTVFSSAVHRISALCVLIILPMAHYGLRVLLLVLFGILGAVAAEVLWQLAPNFPRSLSEIKAADLTISDLNAFEIGLTCALLMPACGGYILTAFTAFTAVMVGKLPFGGSWRTPFIPSLVGYCLSAVCFPEEIFTYSPADADFLSIFGGADGQDAASQLALLRAGEAPETSLADYLLGNVEGPMGGVSLLMLLLSALWLFIGGNLAWQSSAAFLAAGAAFSLVIPYSGAGTAEGLIHDIFGGSTFFCCVFMAGCANYCPKLTTARWFWGGACGALAVIIQHFGATEAGGAFALLIMTPFAWAFDRMVWYFRSRGITYSSVKMNMKKNLQYKMKTKQERELDEI